MKKGDHDSTVSVGTRKARAAQALLPYGTKEKAAQEAGISVVTLWHWLKQRLLREALHQGRREAFSQSTRRLQQASSAAVNTLLRVMAGDDTPPRSRVQAARSVIPLLPKSFAALQTGSAPWVRLARLTGLPGGEYVRGDGAR